MRFFVVLTLLTVPLVSQTRDAGSETIQTLLAEVRQLRFAIERSTLLGTRMQISLQRIQVQEGRTTRLMQELEKVRTELTNGIQVPLVRVTERIKHLEQGAANLTDAVRRRDVEEALKQSRFEQEMLTTREQQARAREAEIAGQVRDEQARLTELHERVNQMERALDDALRHIGGQPTADLIRD